MYIGLQQRHNYLNVPKVNKSFKSFTPKPTLHSIFLAPVSQSDVLNITLKLKPKPALVMIAYRLNFSRLLLMKY